MTPDHLADDKCDTKKAKLREGGFYLDILYMYIVKIFVYLTWHSPVVSQTVPTDLKSILDHYDLFTRQRRFSSFV